TQILFSPDPLDRSEAQSLACFLLDVIKKEIEILLGQISCARETRKLFNPGFDFFEERLVDVTYLIHNERYTEKVGKQF
ncbi:MAG: hypothetical protein C0490_02260, partial [Marivirga sp.]|nr:hypothetical protein [Marivirga sp.]